jgi:hypothetical protein
MIRRALMILTVAVMASGNGARAQAPAGFELVDLPDSAQHSSNVSPDGNWVYRIDLSTDGGRSWNERQIEMTFRRLE